MHKIASTLSLSKGAMITDIHPWTRFILSTLKEACRRIVQNDIEKGNSLINTHQSSHIILWHIDANKGKIKLALKTSYYLKRGEMERSSVQSM
jgi:adenine-specific DNA methylase